MITEDREIKDPKKKESLLDRFKKTLRSSTTTSPSSGIILANTSIDHGSRPTTPKMSPCGLLFRVSLDIVAELGPPLMSVNHYGVPAFMESAFRYILGNESHTEGIFRISGSSATIKTYKKIVDAGGSIEWKEGDAHNATGLVKMYLRELPEPLLTFELFDPFYSAVRVSRDEDKILLVSTVLCALPRCNYSLLKFVIGHLVLLCHNETDTKMGVSNISTLIGPNIGRSINEHGSDQQHMFESTSKATAITGCLLKNYEQLFKEDNNSNTNSIIAFGRAVFDYSPADVDELCLCKDQIVFVDNETMNDGWWNGITVNDTGSVRKGRFPSNYLALIYSKQALLTRAASVKSAEANGQPIYYNPEQEIPPSLEKAIESSKSTVSLKAESSSIEQKEEQKLIENSMDKVITRIEEVTDEHSLSNEGLSVYSYHHDDSGEDIFMSKSLSGTPPEGCCSHKSGFGSANFANRLLRMENEIAQLRVQLVEEQLQRKQLASIIPMLMKNQDEVITLLHTIKQTEQSVAGSITIKTNSKDNLAEKECSHQIRLKCPDGTMTTIEDFENGLDGV